MKSYNLLVAKLLILCLVLFGCSEQNAITNEYLVDTSSSIIGRVTPNVENTEVSIWQVEQTARTNTDSLGYFELVKVPAGIYEMHIQTADGFMKIPNIEVKKNETTSLGEIKFNNLLWPFTNSYPAHNDNSVSLNLYQIQFNSDISLDINSFNNAVLINPPLRGSWRTSSNRYYYYLEGQLLPDTEYTVTILPSLKLFSGESWGDSLQISFITNNFKLTSKNYSFPLDEFPLLNNYNYFIRYRYNLLVDSTKVQSVISIDPPVELDIHVSTNSQGSDLYIRNVENFLPNQTYTLTISKDLESESGIKTGVDEVLVFTTEGLKVTNYGFYRYNSAFLDNIADPYGILDLTIRLNAIVDINSFNQAVTISPDINGSWHLIERYNRYLFIPDSIFYRIPEQTYTVTIDGSVDLSNGEGLGSDITLEYHIDPIAITTISPYDGGYLYSGSIVKIRFNSSMNKSITETAFRCKLVNGGDVAGAFSWSSDSTQLTFTSTVSFTQNQYYEVIVDTTAENIDGYKLKEAGYSLFKKL